MKKSAATAVLRWETLPFFKNMDAEQFEVAKSVLHCANYPNGHILMGEDQPSDRVFFLLDGMARISIRRDGEDIVLGMRGPGDILGEIGAIDGLPRVANVYTHTPCVCLVANQHDFNHILLEMKPFSQYMNRFLASRVRRLTNQLEAMGTLSVQARLARQVCFLGDEYGVTVPTKQAATATQIPFRITQSDLSQMIGATRVHVNQIFCTWKERQFIEIDKSRLVILDKDALGALVA